MKPTTFLAGGALVAALAATGVSAQVCPTVERQPASVALMDLLDADPVLKDQLAESIALGQRINPDPRTNPVATLEDYYGFIDALVTYNPRNIETGIEREGIRVSMDGEDYCNWNILDMLAYSYFLVDRQITTDPRGQVQFLNAGFSDWMRSVAEYWGKYLETKDSARFVPSFVSDPIYSASPSGDWFCPPEGGYDTFQHFFTRELCREKFPNASRPVAGYSDPRTVVSVGDSNSMGTWPISRDGKLVTGYDRVSEGGRFIKGKLYSDIDSFVLGENGEEVLQTWGEIDPSIFHGGTFSHQFLDVNNYHRLHVPVAGRLVYMRHFRAATRMKSNWKPSLDPLRFGVNDQVGFYDPADTPDWQFGQTRLVIGIETPDYGIVLISPMGMAQVSGIQLRDWVQLDAEAEKGWEFGNFAFGGSDFVVLFEDRADFVLTVPTEPSVPPGAGVNYEPSFQGQRYGCFGDDDTCSASFDGAQPAPYPGYQ